MNSLQQVIERKPAGDRNGNLAIENELPSAKLTECSHQLRKVAGERLSRLGLHVDVLSVAKGQTAKSVPFWFVLPRASGRQLVNGEGLHRLQGRL
jgi:hypothetical protein